MKRRLLSIGLCVVLLVLAACAGVGGKGEEVMGGGGEEGTGEAADTPFAPSATPSPSATAEPSETPVATGTEVVATGTPMPPGTVVPEGTVEATEVVPTETPVPTETEVMPTGTATEVMPTGTEEAGEVVYVEDYYGLGEAVKVVYPPETAEDVELIPIQVRDLGEHPATPGWGTLDINGLTIVSLQRARVTLPGKTLGAEVVPERTFEEVKITFGYVGDDGKEKTFSMTVAAYLFVSGNWVSVDKFLDRFDPGDRVDVFLKYNFRVGGIDDREYFERIKTRGMKTDEQREWADVVLAREFDGDRISLSRSRLSGELDEEFRVALSRIDPSFLEEGNN